MTLPTLWSIVRARLRGLVHRDGVADEIRDELDFHIRMRAEEYERRGAAPAEADRLARRRVGNLSVLRDRGYDERGGGVMDTIWQDVRYGSRLLWAHRGFSAVAILTLALGIGMSTALASVIDAAILHPLPYPHPEDLAVANVETIQRNGRHVLLGPSYEDVLALRAAAHSLSAIGTWKSLQPNPIVNGPQPERLEGVYIDDGYLAVYGGTPLLGRGIVANDLRDGADPVLLLGFDYWQKRFSGDARAIGQTLRFDDGLFTIVGVLPKTFERAVAIWRPLHVVPAMRNFRGSGTSVEVRLRPGVTFDAAQRDMSDVLSRLPGGQKSHTVQLRSLLDSAVAGNTTTVSVIAWAVALILVLACVNVAGLLLARGATRHSELAIRAAIGAGRLRLIRQLLTESVLLAIVGGGAGIVVAWWSLDAIVANIPIALSSDQPAALDWRVLAFSAALAVLTGVLFGLAPAWRLSRAGLSTTIARGSPRTGSALSRRGGQWLIGVETALALVLLAGAGLMLRSFVRILDVDLGFRPESIVTIESAPVTANAATYATYYTSLVGAVRAMPGVAAAGAIDDLPLKGSAMFLQVSSPTSGPAAVRNVLPGYFEAMGLAPLEGRVPTDADLTSGRPVVVINDAAVKQFFPDGHAIGRTLVVSTTESEIIGVMDDIRFNGPLLPSSFGGPLTGDAPEVFQLYRPAADSAPRSLIVVVRPSGSPAGLADRLRQVAQTVGPRVIVERVRNGTDWLDARIITPRRRTVLLTLLGALGLVLALVGVFGMTAYGVARRTQEIGVRMAFGARPRDVVGRMLRDAAIPVGAGIVLGLGGAVLGTRLIATFLFQTTPTDPETLAVVALTLAATAVIAAWIPARRAARVDPVTAMRTE